MKEVEIKKSEAQPPSESGSYNDLNPSGEILARLGSYLAGRYKKIKGLQEYSDWMAEKGRAFNAYHMVPRPRGLPFEGAANLASPFPRIGVDSFHANVMASLFVDKTRMSVVPVLVKKESANTAKKACDFMTYVVNHEADLYTAVDSADLRAQIFGIGYLEPHYLKEIAFDTIEVTETKKVPVMDQMTGEIRYEEKTEKKKQKKKRTKFDGVKVDSIPVECLRMSPFVMSIEEAVRADVLFKDFQINYWEVKERAKEKDGKTYYRKDGVDKMNPGVVGKITANLNHIEQQRAAYDGFYLEDLFKGETVELVQGYLWYDIDGDGTKEEITVVFHPDSEAVLRVSLTPCRIVEIVPRPIDGRFMGEGIPKITMRLDEEWETFHNTRANAGQWENSFFGFYRAGGRFNPQIITIKPNHFYPVDDPREVVFPQTQRVGSSYFQEEQILFNIFERILALDENFQGVSSRKAKSATETLNVSQRSSIRFGNPFHRIVGSINRLLGHIWELSKECSPEDKEYYTVGNDGAPIFDKMSKYDYSASLKFSPAVQSVFDKQNRRDSLLMAYRLFLVNPIVQAHPASIYDLSQKTLDELEVGVSLPKPPQAKTLSPYEEHELFKAGEDPEPEPGEDVDHHYKTHLAQLNANDISEWDPESVKKLVLHLDKTKILKMTLDSANLNQSGMAQHGMMPQPGVTSNKNPTQSFNTMKVGETGNSMKANLQNGQKGVQNVEENVSQFMGPL